ncbi:hypothetical protein VNO77_22291 [Canavalia gladiata]|uniref:Fibronectin type III-like domain-containing protein n=1 Tax=Canavalia gladiata TaxID=3824 RepID=A0AAN9QAW2_CANGL
MLRVSWLDLDCENYLGQYTEGVVKQRFLDEASINIVVSNNFSTLMCLGFFDGDLSKQPYGNLGPQDICTSQNQELAHEATRQGIVLLKNSPRSLPLNAKAIKSLAVIGPNANAIRVMIGNYEGILCNNISPLQGVTTLVPTCYTPGYPNVQCENAQLDDATKIATFAYAIVIVVGASLAIEAESLDRINILLPGQEQLLVCDVANASKGPVILVSMSRGCMDVSFAKTNDEITRTVWVGYPNEASGATIANVIFGFNNPSTMIEMNFRADPTTSYPGRTYRFYKREPFSHLEHRIVKASKLVSFPLAEDHVCHSSKCKSLDVADENCQNLAFDFHLRVKNIRQMSSSHIVLLFFTSPNMHNAPKKYLLAFEKVHSLGQLEAHVRFKVDVCKDLNVVDELGNRKVPLGQHLLIVGNLKYSLGVRI